MSEWAKPKPSEVFNAFLDDELPGPDPGVSLADYVGAIRRALCRFLDQDAEQRSEQRRPDAQV